MLNLRLADFNFLIDNKYGYLEETCADYLSDGTPHLSVTVTEEEIKREQADGVDNMGYLESLAVYRKIAEWLPCHDAFLMHGTVIDVDGCGIAFLAKSGVGKTTHMTNWKALLGNRLTVVNGDKPLIRLVDGNLYAYGTPWAGKERLHTNMKTPLKKVCFIERATSNSCEKLDKNVLHRLLPQVYKPADQNALVKTLGILDKVIEGVDFYTIKCNKELSSAEIAYNEIINN
ncbi:MAG: hypothetical protein IKL05_06780 [Clostridia bacterium]|nr:hypothetical protein [Clostridia bacterium]